MDQKVKLTFLSTLTLLTLVNSGVLPAPKVLEGPSSRTTIIGPDGSKISAFAPGGKIVLDENPGQVLQGAPDVVAIAGVAQPVPKTKVVEEVSPEVTKVHEKALPSQVKSILLPKNISIAENTSTGTTATISATEVISESLEILESSTNSPAIKKLTKTPFEVLPLRQEIVPVGLKTSESAPVAYALDPPHDVPEVSEFTGEYIPENLFEKEILGL